MMRRLDLEVLDALIRFWQGKEKQAEASAERWLAVGRVDAFQTVRVLLGLPFLPAVEPAPCPLCGRPVAGEAERCLEITAEGARELACCSACLLQGAGSPVM